MSEEREIAAALAANEAFYAALGGGEYRAMDRLWATTEAVACIHPGSAPLHGRVAVMESWKAILSQPPAMEIQEARAVVVRGMAFVTCREQVDDVALAATNIFVWEDGQWRMVHHQAGHLAPTPSPGAGQPLH